MPALSELLPEDDETLLGQLLAFGGVRAGKWAFGDRDFAGKWARMLRRALAMAFQGLKQIDRNWPPTANTDVATLKSQASVFGLSDGEGGFGFRKGSAAVSIQVLITGTSGTVINAGRRILGPSGEIAYTLRGNVQISGAPPGTGQIIGIMDATVKGAAGNLSQGAVCRWESTPAGIDSTLTVLVGTQTGTDEEQAGAAFLRLAERLRLTPKGGAPQDWRAWTQDPKDENGNSLFSNLRAYGFNGGALYQGGGYDGVGAVMVVLTVLGSGLARIPTQAMLDAAVAFVRGSTTREGQAPNAHSYRVIPPYMAQKVTGLVLEAVIVPTAAGKPWAWTRGGANLIVDDWDGQSKLRLSGLAPTSLKQQLDIGGRVFLYLDTRDLDNLPTGLVVPPQVRILSYADQAFKTTLTLETPLPAGFVAPPVGTAVYPGHETLLQRAGQVVVDYVDTLGPSRISGLADPLDPWSSTVTPSGIVGALTSLLSDTDRLIDYVVTGTAKIGVGGAATAAVDLDPPDNGPYGPAMWHALRVLIKDPV